MNYVDNGATLSTRKEYRYDLWRIWNQDTPPWNFVMLNPSTADERLDDPTITRCTTRAKQGGAGGIVVTNLFAYRTKDPEQMIRMQKLGCNIAGPDNDRYLSQAACLSSKIICGWGAHAGRAALQGHAEHVLILLTDLFREKLHYLKLSATGRPCHPLYLPYTLRPKLWKYPGLREANQ